MAIGVCSAAEHPARSLVMVIPLHRLPRLGLILIALCAASVASAACSGGYGGGGYGGGGGTGYLPAPPVDPTYTPSSTAFSPDASGSTDRSVLVVLQRKSVPIGIWDDSLVSLSKVMPFVLYQDDEAAAFAQRWSIPGLPAVALCDRLGNVIAAIDTRVSAAGIHALVDHAVAEKAVLDKGLGALYQKAEAAVKAKRMSAAFQSLDVIAHYKGLAACAQADALRARLLTDGETAISIAVTHDRPEARTELDAVLRVWRGTQVGDAARKALHELE
jgi:hypothetical protein